MKKTRLLMAVLAAMPLPANAQAPDRLAAIDRAVAGFTGAEIGQPGGAVQPVDRRLALAPCAAPLALSWYGARRDTVLVQCPDAGSWRLYVPTSGGVMAASQPPAIQRGDAVTIAVQGDGFAVAQAGEALETGAAGAWIKVRPAANGAPPMRARIVRPGLVTVSLDTAS